MTEGLYGTGEARPPGPAEPAFDAGMPVSSPGAGGMTGSTAGPQSTADTAKEQAKDVAQQGVEGGKHVAAVAADQAKEVASETGRQASALFQQARSELAEQLSSQQGRVADQLHSISKEFGSMASRSEEDGLAKDLAQQASQRVGTVAHWLEDREPGALVDELRRFARNRPGTFLAMAAGLGLVAGRMTRGVRAGAQEEEMAAASAGYPSSGAGHPAPSPVYPATSPVYPSQGTYPAPTPVYPSPGSAYPSPGSGYAGQDAGYAGQGAGYPGQSQGAGYPGQSQAAGYPAQGAGADVWADPTVPGYSPEATASPETGLDGPHAPHGHESGSAR